MAGIVPLVVLSIISLCFYARSRSAGRPCIREAILKGAVVWGLLIVAITELSSPAGLLSYWPVLIAWGLSGLAGLLVIMKYRKARPAGGKPAAPAHPQDASDAAKAGGTGPGRPERLGPLEWIVLAGTTVIVLGVFVTAIVAPPNNWDSMTYHLPRVQHWIANRSVAHYPTNITRQLYLSPMAEFAILHLQLLAGSDRLVNMVQFLAMVGSLAGVSLIARRLGAGIRGQVFAAAICAAIPMGILQASSTQNDYVAAFWLVCMVNFVLTCRKSPAVHNFAFAGASLALAALTKSTAYLYALPFAVWLAGSGAAALKARLWRPAALVMVIFVLVNAGHWTRNFELYGTIAGKHADVDAPSIYRNQTHSPGEILSNLVRNLALHCGTPDQDINHDIEQAVIALHDWLGIGINDPATTYTSTSFHLPGLSYHEDTSGNSLHLFLALLTVMIFALSRPLRTNRTAMLYLLCLSIGFLLFCGYLKWQPWHSRLHLPLFVLGSSVVAIALERLNKGLGLVIVLVVLACSLPWVLENKSRPLIGGASIFVKERQDMYFTNRPDLQKTYTDISQLARRYNLRRIGLVIGEDDWEYPFWLLLRQDVGPDVRIVHVEVANDSAGIAQDNTIDAVIRHSADGWRMTRVRRGP